MPSDRDTRRLASKARIADIATDPTVMDLERRHLFFRSWQFACHVSDLAEPGSYASWLLVRPGADKDHLAAGDKFGAEKVGAEDRALVEAVQKRMHSQGFNQGLYMVDPEEETFTEEGVRVFHSNYAAVLEDLLARDTR